MHPLTKWEFIVYYLSPIIKIFATCLTKASNAPWQLPSWVLFFSRPGYPHTRARANPFERIKFYRWQNSTVQDLKLLYSHDLNSNSRPLVKLKEIRAISPKPPVVLGLDHSIKNIFCKSVAELAEYLIVHENDVFVILFILKKNYKARIIIITMRSQTSLSCNMASIIKYYDCVWSKYS